MNHDLRCSKGAVSEITREQGLHVLLALPCPIRTCAVAFSLFKVMTIVSDENVQGWLLMRVVVGRKRR